MKRLRCNVVPIGLSDIFTKGVEYEFYKHSYGGTPVWSIKGDLGVWYHTDSISLHFGLVEIPTGEVSTGDLLYALELEISIIKIKIKDLIEQNKK
jgi:hypothetical protein